MDLKLQGKTALVTAASDGLGKATAMTLAREGANVIICSRNPEKLQYTRAVIREQTGCDVRTLTVQLEEAESVHALFETLRQAAPEGVDILVYNVGGPAPGTFATLDEASWERHYISVILNYQALLRQLLPNMCQRQWGRVVGIASVSAKQPLPNLALSNVLRPAVVGLTKTLSIEYGTSGVTFNTVCPGGIFTQRIDDVLSNRAQREGVDLETLKRSYVADIPMRRFGKPEEVGDLVAFLCSERAAFINGTSISIDGGLTRGLY